MWNSCFSASKRYLFQISNTIIFLGFTLSLKDKMFRLQKKHDVHVWSGDLCFSFKIIAYTHTYSELYDGEGSLVSISSMRLIQPPSFQHWYLAVICGCHFAASVANFNADFVVLWCCMQQHNYFCCLSLGFWRYDLMIIY